VHNLWFNSHHSIIIVGEPSLRREFHFMKQDGVSPCVFPDYVSTINPPSPTNTNIFFRRSSPLCSCQIRKSQGAVQSELIQTSGSTAWKKKTSPAHFNPDILQGFRENWLKAYCSFSSDSRALRMRRWRSGRMGSSTWNNLRMEDGCCSSKFSEVDYVPFEKTFLTRCFFSLQESVASHPLPPPRPQSPKWRRQWALKSTSNLIRSVKAEVMCINFVFVVNLFLNF